MISKPKWSETTIIDPIDPTKTRKIFVSNQQHIRVEPPNVIDLTKHK
jgi:hypothetical protein